MLVASVIAARGRGKAARRHAAERASAKREERWPEGCRLPDAWADDPARDRMQVGGLKFRRICSILILSDSHKLDPKNLGLIYLGVPRKNNTVWYRCCIPLIDFNVHWPGYRPNGLSAGRAMGEASVRSGLQSTRHELVHSTGAS